MKNIYRKRVPIKRKKKLLKKRKKKNQKRRRRRQKKLNFNQPMRRKRWYPKIRNSLLEKFSQKRKKWKIKKNRQR